ncbi:MAG: hypothetical protein LBK03_01445 [Bacteroidales bacterium]|nr:hypothetical protein [Bacteroidales bacterium]
MAAKTEKTYNYGKKLPFILERGAIFIPCKINGTTHLVRYSAKSRMNIMGGGGLREKISGNDKFPQCNKTIKLRTNTYVLKCGIRYYDMESDFFRFKNFAGVVTSLSNDTVASKYRCEGSPRFIIGRTCFPDRKDAMLLSFSDTTITLFDSCNIYDTTGFTLLKSDNSCGTLTVYLTVDSVECKFIFSADSPEFLALPQYEHDISTAGYRQQNASNIAIDTLTVQQASTIAMGGYSLTGNILYNAKLLQPVMGMAFISHFDWIIDNYREKIYARKIGCF